MVEFLLGQEYIKKMKIHVFQHVPFEGFAMIQEWGDVREHQFTRTLFYEAEATIPSVVSYDALIILGGPMGVFDEMQYPWLRQEKLHIKAAIDEGKKLLGVCLGAQLIATVLEAPLKTQSFQEIGWYPVYVVNGAKGHPILFGLNTEINALHWHNDQFEIPVGALHLMWSQACKNQAFLYDNRVLGLQFHLEMDLPAIEQMIEVDGRELSATATTQTAKTLLQQSVPHITQESLFILLDNWLHLEFNITDYIE